MPCQSRDILTTTTTTTTRVTTLCVSPGAVRAGIQLSETFAGRKILLGVDRLDYIKGMPHKVREGRIWVVKAYSYLSLVTLASRLHYLSFVVYYQGREREGVMVVAVVAVVAVVVVMVVRPCACQAEKVLVQVEVLDRSRLNLFKATSRGIMLWPHITTRLLCTGTCAGKLVRDGSRTVDQKLFQMYEYRHH